MKAARTRQPEPLPPRTAPARVRVRAFSLIEMIGVLAIMALLVAVAAESVMRRLRLTAQQAEEANLLAIADAIQQGIVRNQVVPGANTWVDLVVEELSLAPARIEANAAGNSRLLLIDPAFRVGTTTNGVPPFTQTLAGAVAVTSPRMILLSSLALALPAITNSASVFSNIWNTATDAIPAGWSSAWTGYGQDLKIQRIHLRALFHRVVLENLDDLRTAPYSIENPATTTNITATGRREVWFIHNTAFNLHYYPDLASSTTQLLGREYIDRDSAYAFENGTWTRYPLLGLQATNSFGWMADRFRSRGYPSTRVASATAQAVTDAMCDYLLAMALHASSGNPSDSATPPATPYLRMAYDAQIRLALVSSNLTK